MICLHAAESNIEIMEQALSDTPIQIQHEVDSHLLKLIREERPFHEQKDYAYKKIMALTEQQPDFILITCTNYIVLVDHIDSEIHIPLLKIDELLFDQLKEAQMPIKLIFTNKQTIAGTMARLKQTISPKVDIEVIFIPEVFDWYLSGDKNRHDQKLFNTLHELDTPQTILAVAQLSMANCAERYSQLSGKQVLSPITAIKNKGSVVF